MQNSHSLLRSSFECQLQWLVAVDPCRVPLQWPPAAAPDYSREISQRLSTQCLSNLFKCHPSFLSKQSFYRLTDRSNPRCFIHLRWSCFHQMDSSQMCWLLSTLMQDGLLEEWHFSRTTSIVLFATFWSKHLLLASSDQSIKIDWLVD